MEQAITKAQNSAKKNISKQKPPVRHVPYGTNARKSNYSQ